MLRRGEPGGGALQGVGFADKIDQDLPHKPGGDVVEMGTAGPIGLILADEAEEGFVNEFGGAKFGTAIIVEARTGETGTGEAAEFAVDEGGEGLKGGLVAGAPLVEEERE